MLTFVCFSFSYLHMGEPKQWYGIPGLEADAFERVARKVLPDLFKRQTDLLYHIVTMVRDLPFSALLCYSPMSCAACACVAGVSSSAAAARRSRVHGVPRGRQLHRHLPAGLPRRLQPRSTSVGSLLPLALTMMHCDRLSVLACTQFNIAEAVNFAAPDWLSFGVRGFERYRIYRRQPVFSHDLLMCRLAQESGVDIRTIAWSAARLLDLAVGPDPACLQAARWSRASARRGAHASRVFVLARHHARRLLGRPVQRCSFSSTSIRCCSYSLPSCRGLRQEGPHGEDVQDVQDGPVRSANGVEEGMGLTCVPWCISCRHNKLDDKIQAQAAQCIICRHGIYVSAISCPCTQKLSCLRHAKEVGHRAIVVRLLLWACSFLLSALRVPDGQQAHPVPPLAQGELVIGSAD